MCEDLRTSAQALRTIKATTSTDRSGSAASQPVARMMSAATIEDQRTDPRIRFVGGIRGTRELVRRVDAGEASVAFSFYAVTPDELLAVADAGRTMPPKSTWFEPKLRSGLFTYLLEEPR